MSYSIDIDLAAQDAIAALPVDALLAVAEVFAAPIGDLRNIPDVRLGRSSAGPQPVDHPYG